MEDYQPMQFDFPNEDVMVIRDCETPSLDKGPESGSRWELVSDGALNSIRHGIGVVITSLIGYHIPFMVML